MHVYDGTTNNNKKHWKNDVVEETNENILPCKNKAQFEQRTQNHIKLLKEKTIRALCRLTSHKHFALNFAMVAI